MRLPQTLDRSDPLFKEIAADPEGHIDLMNTLRKFGIDPYRTWRYEVEGDRIKCFEYHYTDALGPHVEAECPDGLHSEPAWDEVCSVVVYR